MGVVPSTSAVAAISTCTTTSYYCNYYSSIHDSSFHLYSRNRDDYGRQKSCAQLRPPVPWEGWGVVGEQEDQEEKKEEEQQEKE